VECDLVDEAGAEQLLGGLGAASDVLPPAAARAVTVYGLEPYRVEHPGLPGLIFGHATLDEATIRRGVKILAAAR
jgi:hypothetical protein